MQFSKQVLALTLTAAVIAPASAAITYVDVNSGTDGETLNMEFLNAGTWTASSAWAAGDNNTDNKWGLRTSGPAANAAETDVFQASHSENAPALRMILTGLDVGTTYEFFVYNTRAGGAAIIQVGVSTDTTVNAALPTLTTYSDGGTAVDSVGNEAITTGDQRFRYSLGTFSGSSTYAFYFDDFTGGAAAHPGDRATLDGIGYEATVPEPGSVALLGLGGLAMLRRRRK